MTKTILITGGAGFIGSHLCDKLIKEDCKVICVDNFITGSIGNIANLLTNDRFEMIKHDIVDPLFIEKKINYIFNLACPAAPIHYQTNPIKTIKTNTIGVINILGLAKNHGARILQASTSEIYGDPKIHPQTEDYLGNVSTIGPRACYDEGKRVAETLFTEYNREHGLDIRIARIFNTYGPKMAVGDGRVMPNFITQALANKNITIYGDGSQTRSFCYISDLVDGLYKLMMSDSYTGPMNLGNPSEITINELTKTVIKMTDSKSNPVYVNLPKDDPTKRRPDISKAKKELNWNPKISLEEGLKSTIEYFENTLRNQ